MLPASLDRILRDADGLLIVPPFASLDRPSLGAHVLQACARAQGFDVQVLYASVLLAHALGEDAYQRLACPFGNLLPGELVFAPAAYGASLAEDAEAEAAFPALDDVDDLPVNREQLAALAGPASAWAKAVARTISQYRYRVVGCTTTFEQTAASHALLRPIKRHRPETLAIIGGANCEGPMAEGMRALCPDLDYIFSGECEAAFPAFLKAIAQGQPPDTAIIRGTPCQDMDSVPTPDFADYYAQLDAFLPGCKLLEDGEIWLPYETSRGCWWGQKHHCTFCGLNGEGMGFREKSPDRALDELQILVRQHPTNKVCMSDNIMPYRFFRTLLPRLEAELPGLHIFYEQKANLSFAQVAQLKRAGVQVFQPGIEALSTPLLRLMRKGVTAAQNIALLRYARVTGLTVMWNMLCDFPGDRVAWYEETAALLPLLAHLHPPEGVYRLNIDRFSPYFNDPAAFGMRRLRPHAAYADVVPSHIDPADVAYHFEADYASAARSHPAVLRTLKREVAAWRARWASATDAPPLLSLTPLTDDAFLLVDTRGLDGTVMFDVIEPAQAAMALVGRSDDAAQEAWAVARKVCVRLDGRLVPLATAEARVLTGFEERFGKARRRAAARVAAA